MTSMSTMLLRRDVEGALDAPAPRRGLPSSLRRLDAWGRADGHRGLVAAAAIVGLAVFVLGAGNRFTRGPLFLYIPEVGLVPPLGRAAWQQAFAIHQQSPLFALCGGYQVGGMESLTVYQMLYLWEWLRVGSLWALCALGLLLVALALRQAATSPTGSRAAALVGSAVFGITYLVLRVVADHAGLFAAINLGQHRHALDVTFASLGLACLVVTALPGGQQCSLMARVAWAIPVVLAIAFGALTEAMDAGAQWRSFPFYADGVLPGPDRLFAFSPVWRNLTENGYLIQAAHRVLSFALWLTALIALSTAVLRGHRFWPAVALFGLLTLDGALGASTLMFGDLVVLSIAHQVLAVFVLAAALAAPWPPERPGFRAVVLSKTGLDALTTVRR
jgi:cytochrome c oxidase assembly protein subunit 15